MDVRKGIAVLTANLGGIDKPIQHVEQSMEHDYFEFNDGNFPPRTKAMTSRLQAKIPKFFAWQLWPGYDFYLWLDGNIALTSPKSLKHYFDAIKDHDIVVLRHPRRPNIRQEARYLRKGLREQSRYLVARYDAEWTPEQIAMIEADRKYTDDLLVIGGIFMYRNTPAIQKMFKEWWYLTSRYSVFDQIAFTYALKKSGVKMKILDEDFNKSPYISHGSHKYRTK